MRPLLMLLTAGALWFLALNGARADNDPADVATVLAAQATRNAPAASGLAPAQETPRLQVRQTRDGEEPTAPAWPLALGGLAVLGSVAMLLRRRGGRG